VEIFIISELNNGLIALIFHHYLILKTQFIMNLLCFVENFKITVFSVA
jgi:hypothetical protein